MAKIQNTVNQQSKSKKDAFMERMRQRHPGTEYPDEESIYGGINDDYDNYDSQLETYKKNEEDIGKLMDSDPRSASFLAQWAKGSNPATELVRRFGKTELTDAINDPAKLDEIAKADAEYIARVAKEKELEDMYMKNMDVSLQNIEAFQKETGMSDDEIDAGFILLQKITQDAIVGKIDPETLALVMKGQRHDADVEQAAQEAETKGKNAKIDLSLRKNEKRGLPATLGSKNARTKGAGIASPSGMSIWNRGK